jgi:hypothetical protein
MSDRSASAASAFVPNPHEDSDGNEVDPVGNEKPKSRRKLSVRERDYIVPAKDTRGVSYRNIFRSTPELTKICADVVASRKYPFRQLGDLYRYCVYTLALELAAQAGIKSVVAQAEMIGEILRDDLYNLQFDEIFRSMKLNVDRHMERGNEQNARALVVKVHDAIKTMPEGHWREHYETELLQRYGRLLDGLDYRQGQGRTGGVDNGGTPVSMFASHDED